MRNVASLIAALFVLTGCSGGNQSGSTSNNPLASTATSAITAASTTPTISGQPVTSLNVGTPYVFLPNWSEAGESVLTFAIQNKPSWATFDTSTGELAGTPGISDIGNYDGILISASNGVTTAELPAFNITVTQYSIGSATLSWIPPTTNLNGTPLTNLAGYRIYYGTNSSSLNQSVQVSNPGIASYVIGNLSPATWYFSLVSYNSTNIESPLSQIVSKTTTS